MDNDDKAAVLGMVERGGEVITRVVESAKSVDVYPVVEENVREGTTVYTDEAWAFRAMDSHGYTHESVNHLHKEYVRGSVHTNSIESFWSHFKRSVSRTYVCVSKQHLQTYLCEFEFLYNLRKQPSLMLDLLLQSFQKP